MKLAEEIHTHTSHYLALFGMFTLGLILFTMFAGIDSLQLAVAGGMALLYVIWGIIHHMLEDDLNLTIVLEYVFTALLMLVFIWGVLKNT